MSHDATEPAGQRPVGITHMTIPLPAEVAGLGLRATVGLHVSDRALFEAIHGAHGEPTIKAFAKGDFGARHRFDYFELEIQGQQVDVYFSPEFTNGVNVDIHEGVAA